MVGLNFFRRGPIVIALKLQVGLASRDMAFLAGTD